MPRSPRLGSYQAAIYGTQHVLGSGRTWHNVTEVRAYVDDLVQSDEFQDTWPDLYHVNVERRHSSARWSMAVLDSNTICLADLCQTTVLHELAHLCTPHDTCGHGPEFARAYLTLVRREMGFHAYGAFLSALKATDAFRGCDLTTLDAWV